MDDLINLIELIQQTYQAAVTLARALRVLQRRIESARRSQPQPEEGVAGGPLGDDPTDNRRGISPQLSQIPS